MSVILPFQSRSVARGGHSIPVRGTVQQDFETNITTALEFLFERGITFYYLNFGLYWNSAYVVMI